MTDKINYACTVYDVGKPIGRSEGYLVLLTTPTSILLELQRQRPISNGNVLTSMPIMNLLIEDGALNETQRLLQVDSLYLPLRLNLEEAVAKLARHYGSANSRINNNAQYGFLIIDQLRAQKIEQELKFFAGFFG